MTFDKKYFEENEPRFLAELFSLIRIPSISAKPSHKADMTRCAERWCELLVEAGADHARLMPSAGNPLVYAERHVSDDARTVLIYAHYDVMPAEPLELWKSNPFEPEVRDGHIFARGADDDKGQAFIQVKAFEYLVRNNLLKHNVKFIFEGEEEIGSPSLAAFLEEHKELLKCDVILVSDTSMLGADLPSLTTGLRGLAYWQIEVTGEEAWAIALYCAIRHIDSIEDAIISAVNHDGDSDSTGAVCGNIMGAVYGYEAIKRMRLFCPQGHELEQTLELSNIILTLADDLYTSCIISEYDAIDTPAKQQWYERYCNIKPFGLDTSSNESRGKHLAWWRK